MNKMTLKTHRIDFHLGAFRGYHNPVKPCREIVTFLNRLFTKTTCRRFVLGDVEEDVVEKDVPTGGQTLDFPEMFKIDVWLFPGDAKLSHFTTAAGDGAVYARYPALGSHFLNCSIAHEIGHCFGVAIGEYEKIWMVSDFTGAWPGLKVSGVNPYDHYWHRPERLEWLSDPMLAPGPVDPKFCWLSSWIINKGIHRRPLSVPMPDLSKIPILVSPSHSRVRIWNRKTPSVLQLDQTVEGGRLTLNWGCDHANAISNDQFRTIKVYPGDPDLQPYARGLSIWDVQEAFLRQGENYRVTLTP